MNVVPAKNADWVFDEIRRFTRFSMIGRYFEDLHKNRLDYGADILIKHGDGSRLVLHSVVAGAHCGFFREVLQKRKPPFKMRISVDEFSSTAVVDAIQFMYEAQFQPTSDRLPDLLILTNKWQMFELKGILEEILCCTIRKNPVAWLPYCIRLAGDSRCRLSTTASDYILSMALDKICLRAASTLNFAQLAEPKPKPERGDPSRFSPVLHTARHKSSTRSPPRSPADTSELLFE